MNTLIKSNGKFYFKLGNHPLQYGYKRYVNTKIPVQVERNGKSTEWLLLDEMPESFIDVMTRNEFIGYKIKEGYEDKGFESTHDKDFFDVDYDDECLHPEYMLYEKVYGEKTTTTEKTIIKFDEELDEDIEEPVTYDGNYDGNLFSKNTIVKVIPIPSQVHAFIYPNIVLPSKPCAYTSDQMYQIIRNHVILNIDPRYAKITSNYDFCFTVKKPLAIPPITKSYDSNWRSRSKKIKMVSYRITDREVEVFEMTPQSHSYKGYSVISGITAKSHKELQKKVDELLDKLMEEINEPLKSCEHCDGTGVVEASRSK